MTGNTSRTSLRDHLTTTTDKGKIELTQLELSRVTGGRKAGEHPTENLTLNFAKFSFDYVPQD